MSDGSTGAPRATEIEVPGATDTRNDNSAATSGNNEVRRSDSHTDTIHAVDLGQQAAIEQAQSSANYPTEAAMGGPDAEGRKAGRPEVVGKDEREQFTGVAGMSGQQRSELGMDRIADAPADRDHGFAEENVH